MALTRITKGPRHILYQTEQVDATGTNTSDAVPVASFTAGGWQVIHAGVTGTVTYQFESSNDGVNWDPITGATGLTTNGAAGSRSESFSGVLPGVEIRLAITGADTGTLDIYFICKEG